MRLWILSCVVALLTACGGSSDPSPAVIVAYGDSLTDNNGDFVTPSVHWVEQLKAQIQAEGLDEKAPITVINEGLGGEDSAGALKRLPAVLAQHRPTHIILTHGTNDIPPFCPDCAEVITRPALESMAQLARQSGAQVIMGDFTLRIFGNDTAQRYTQAYQLAARNTGSTYVHMVAGLPYDASVYNKDGIHHNDGAQTTLKNNLAAVLLPMLR